MSHPPETRGRGDGRGHKFAAAERKWVMNMMAFFLRSETKMAGVGKSSCEINYLVLQHVCEERGLVAVDSNGPIFLPTEMESFSVKA